MGEPACGSPMTRVIRRTPFLLGAISSVRCRRVRKLQAGHERSEPRIGSHIVVERPDVQPADRPLTSFDSLRQVLEASIGIAERKVHVRGAERIPFQVNPGKHLQGIVASPQRRVARAEGTARLQFRSASEDGTRAVTSPRSAARSINWPHHRVVVSCTRTRRDRLPAVHDSSRQAVQRGAPSSRSRRSARHSRDRRIPACGQSRGRTRARPPVPVAVAA
jgi:hypothetical protein